MSQALFAQKALYFNVMRERFLKFVNSYYFTCSYTEAYSEPCQTSKMKCFAKMFNSF